MSLSDAIAAVKADQPPPLNLGTHPVSLQGLGELLSKRQQEQETPAA